MRVSQKIGEELTIVFIKTKEEFNVTFIKSEEEPNMPGTLTGREVGFFVSKMKMIYDIYRSWYKFRRKKA